MLPAYNASVVSTWPAAAVGRLVGDSDGVREPDGVTGGVAVADGVTVGVPVADVVLLADAVALSDGGAVSDGVDGSDVDAEKLGVWLELSVGVGAPDMELLHDVLGELVAMGDGLLGVGDDDRVGDAETVTEEVGDVDTPTLSDAAEAKAAPAPAMACRRLGILRAVVEEGHLVVKRRIGTA